MKSILNLIFAIALVLGMSGCGGGGGAGGSTSTVTAAAPAVDFAGTWSGTFNGSAIVFQISQSDNSISITRTTPSSAGITYTATANGNTAVVSTFGNGTLIGTTTWTKISDTKITAVVNSCTNIPGFTCGAPVGSILNLTRPSIAVASTLSFPALAAYKAFVANGFTKTLTVSGDCNGTATLGATPANTPSTFEGTNGFSRSTSVNMSFSNCTPSNISSTSTDYYDTNYNPPGSNSASEYSVVSVLSGLPVNVRVGDSGVLGAIQRYSDSTKSISIGNHSITYVVWADTANTALIKINDVTYTGSTTTSIEEDSYRITANGQLSFLSFDIKTFNGTSVRLLGN